MPVVSIKSMFFIRLYRLVAVLVLMPLVVLGQSQNQNYVKSTTYKVETSTSISNPSPEEALVQISYFDGLGRPIQQVAYAQGHGGQDIITHIEYDAFGRQTKEYLPYVRPAASLNFSSSAQSEVMAFYASNNPSVTLNPHFATTGNPYSEKLLESSPLNRVYRQAAPGDVWALNLQGNDHSIKFDYQTNEYDEVLHFHAETTWNASKMKYDISLQEMGFHKRATLYKTITKDENWTGGTLNTTEEFKDKLGRVVLKRTYNTDGAYDTYYVYDDYGNLTYVIPPLVNTQDEVDSTELSELCYQYKYDYRNRLVEKKLPGKTWEYIVYDKLDQVSMTGPVYDPFGNQELGWMVTKYDAFGRVVYTGWYQEGGLVDSQTRADYQSVKNNENGVPGEQRVSSGVVDSQDIKYSNTFFPTQITLLGVNYYDDYDFPGLSAMTSDVYGQEVTSQVKGLNTGAWVRVLSSSSVVFEKSTVLYDEKGRVLRTYKTNYQGGFHQTDVLLDFTGKVIESETTHRYNANATPVTVLEKFTYSPQDRLLTLTHQINQGVEEMIQNNEYDALGQLISKRVGGDYSQSTDGYQKIDYRYNIRGWLTDINEINALNAGSGLFEDLFAFQIRYDNPDGHYNGEVDALYNGNISETFWISNTDGVLRKYGYKYDALNRLKDAYFQRPYSINPVCSSYDEYLSYDKNGNILSLIRNGHLESFDQPNLIDELEYFYQGNRLTKVTDHSVDPHGFKDGNISSSPDYYYDDFGNMIHDENKKIELIEYNHLNLPTTIFLDSGTISYLYNAAGQKLNKHVYDINLGAPSLTEYLDGFQYNNSELQFFSHPEGYVLNTPDKYGDPSYDYVYQYKDHLGNIRMNFVFDPGDGSSSLPQLKTLEENHYYPFGLKHENYNVEKKKMKWELELIGGEEMELKRVRQVPNSGYQYKFNQKELQDELGLDWYDFGLRQYDPALGRFLQIDPVTHHNQSPYVAFDNNPVVFVDPDGADSKDPIKETVTLITSTVDKSNVTHITQTTTNTTTTINDDGSVNVSYSTASITNTVDAYGNVTNGTNVTESSGTITRDAEGNVSSTAGKTTTRNAKEGDSTSALGEWTSTVSSYNKSNDGIYNVDMINKTADATTRATKMGVAVLGGFTAANSLTKGLSPQAKSLLAGLGVSTSAEGLVGQAGGALKDMVGKNNSHAILYGVQHIQNGTVMKAMKTPSGNGAGERKRVGPTSFQDLWKGIKSLFD